jgi:UDP-glucose 6-dehydrogenase
MEEENLDSKTVFTIKHSEIPQGITQCKEHDWVKYSDNEIKCTKCTTINIVNNIEDYVPRNQ